MSSGSSNITENRNRLYSLLLCFSLLVVYSNSFYAEWQYDDFNDIVHNPRIRVSELSIESINQVLHGDPMHQYLVRPISYLTFALNWYLGEDNVFGYHLLNFVIHAATSIILFLTIKLFFLTPNLRGRYKEDEAFIAFMAALLWAINPIQTQAVTYIVQRSTALAALFHLIGIFSYLKARINPSWEKRIPYLMGCMAAFALAMGSKENAITLPLVLIFVEFWFFRPLSSPHTRKAFAFVLSGVILFSIVCGVVFFLNGDLPNILSGYRYRGFTPIERLLTESRILIFYLSQIFYPIPARLNLLHEVELSTSLLTPWTTLASILIILLLIGTAIVFSSKRPFMSFAIIFFFTNHLIESTIIPLQLIFEHRNYLPSLFLFVPVAIAIKALVNFYAHRNRFMHGVIISGIAGITVLVGTGTYVRNMAWATQKSLLEDALDKEPTSHVAYHNLALHYIGRGQIDKAIDLLNDSLIYADSPDDNISAKYYNLGRIYYAEKHDIEKAVVYLKKSLDHYAGNNQARFLLYQVYVQQKAYEKAFEQINLLLERDANNVQLLNEKASVYLHLKQPELAVKPLRQCLVLEPDNWRHYFKIGLILTNNRHYQRGLWFLKKADAMNLKDPITKIGLSYHFLRTGQMDHAESYASNFITLIGLNPLPAYLDKIASKGNFPIDYKLLYPLLRAQVRQKISSALADISSLK